MKLLKVLNKDMISPFQDMQYEIGKEYVCNNFDKNKENKCSTGFYATDIDGLPFAYNINKLIYEVEVGGNSVEIDQFKRRYETIKILRKVSINKILKRIKKEKWEEKVGYKLSEVIAPIYPLTRKSKKDITKKDIELLKQWASVWGSGRNPVWDVDKVSVWVSVGDSVRVSVGDLVWDSVGYLVWDSMWASIGNSESGYSGWVSIWNSYGDSVWVSVGDLVLNLVWDSGRDSVGGLVWNSVVDSVRSYYSSLFPNIKKWKYIIHKKGINPYQPCIDLWKSGLVPSFDGKIWRLHGKGGKILYKELI